MKTHLLYVKVMEISFIYWCIAFIVCAYPLIFRILPKWKVSSRSTSDARDGDAVAREGKGGSQGGDLDSNRFPDQYMTIRNESDRQDQTNTRTSEIVRNGGWKCVCEGGGIGLFLPPSLMKSMGGPGAAMRLGAGGCYHKQA